MASNVDRIFGINDHNEFLECALQTFRYQYHENSVYGEFCNYLKRTPKNVATLEDIPFLPISFFKSKKILSGPAKYQAIFSSSGTTGSVTSKHYVANIDLYIKSFLKGFELFYGPITDYCILALLPSYLEREGSSLVFMVDHLIKKTTHPKSGFYLNDLEALSQELTLLEKEGRPILLIGVSFALLDLAERFELPLQNTIIMETGGMKGRRKEMIRTELHGILKDAFKVDQIHSEYGMTELLSQAYSTGHGNFTCPPWMRVLIRDTEDPLGYCQTGKTGGINVIDLANLHSCAFIATQDLGKAHGNGSFEVLGRFDHSDVRGCNLMVV